MALQAPQYDDARSHVEAPGTEAFDGLAQRDDLVNNLSPQAILDLVARLRANPGPRLVPVTVETGGAPPRDAFRSKYASSTSTAQFHPPQGSVAAAELLAQGWEEPLNNININIHLLMWRFTHNFRLVPQGVEVSHQAEAYHRPGLPGPFSGWLNGHKVELTELETREVNESRKQCSKFGLMWIKPDGSLIEQDEKWGQANQYSGPTLCWHKALGAPCYGPYIAVAKAPTFVTPKRLALTHGRRSKAKQSNKSTSSPPKGR